MGRFQFKMAQVQVIHHTSEGDVFAWIQKILLTKSNAKTKTKEMMEETGLTRRRVEYLLNKLKENGTIKRIGPDKGGYRQVTKH
jgi:ATP-dependent DNA helicase RecG